MSAKDFRLRRIFVSKIIKTAIYVQRHGVSQRFILTKNRTLFFDFVSVLSTILKCPRHFFQPPRNISQRSLIIFVTAYLFFVLCWGTFWANFIIQKGLVGAWSCYDISNLRLAFVTYQPSSENDF